MWKYAQIVPEDIQISYSLAKSKSAVPVPPLATNKTGNNLRAALDHAKKHSAVLLLDEIDAIAKRRSDESDIGELKRLVTVMLQEVHQWPDSGLLLAATNHPELVDPALWRRFDLVLKFDAPDASAIAVAIQRFLGDDLKLFESWVDVLAAGL